MTRYSSSLTCVPFQITAKGQTSNVLSRFIKRWRLTTEIKTYSQQRNRDPLHCWKQTDTSSNFSACVHRFLFFLCLCLLERFVRKGFKLAVCRTPCFGNELRQRTDWGVWWCNSGGNKHLQQLRERGQARNDRTRFATESRQQWIEEKEKKKKKKGL